MEWLIIGVIAGLVYVIVRKRDKREETKDAAGKDGKKCPFCAEWVKAEATVCRYCQRDLPVELAEGVTITTAAAVAENEPGDIKSNHAPGGWRIMGYSIIAVLLLLWIVSLAGSLRP